MRETKKRKDWKDESNEVDQDSRKEESPEKGAAKDTPQQKGTLSHEGGRRRRENPKATLGRRKKGSVQKRNPGDRSKKRNHATDYNGLTKTPRLEDEGANGSKTDSPQRSTPSLREP